MNVGIIANPSKKGVWKALQELLVLLEQAEFTAYVEDDTASDLDYTPAAESKHVKISSALDMSSVCDVVLVMGGDGTMLDAAHRLGPSSVAVAGINLGHLGFLTSCNASEMELLVDALKEKTYHVVQRILLKASVIHLDGQEQSYFAVNDITLTRGQTGRLVALDAFIDGDLLNHYHADGLIVATPTGSTAYSLAAGGPIISPLAKNFVITPICPHSLSNRSLVLTDDSMIELVSVDDAKSTTLFTCDGQNIVEVEHGGRVRVEKADHELNIIRLEGRSFFSTLRQKLHWGEGI